MTDEKEQSVLDRLRESPRTVSALIIILIVAAAIYAFSGDDASEIAERDEDESTEVEMTEEKEEMMEDKEEGMVEGVATTTPVSQDVLSEQAQALPEETRAENAYVETAQPGDGVTHLARRATTRWLSKNSTGYEMTNEHRIYIEDYIQNKLGTNGLALGAEVRISMELMEEAVAAAGNLTNSQLNNLTKYTHNVSF